MLSIIKSMVLQGLEGILINVEIDISPGMPCWDVVGLPDVNIRESKERVKTAIKNCNIELLSRKYIINLSPATIRKDGAVLDFAIAIGILYSMNIVHEQNLEKTLFIGELSLDGKLNKVNGILPICIEAKKQGIKRILLPKCNAKEASFVNELEVIGITDLKEAILYLNGVKKIDCEKFINYESVYNENQRRYIDFSEVKGQKMAKRALEIAAAGGHNCLLIGSPGCGKTMMAKRITTILPNLTFEESLEITKIHSIAGKLRDDDLITERSFRSPHHTITEKALIGGGKIPTPGEISLAHLGVLFLDELLEFKKSTLEVLRIPIEDKVVNISRVGVNISFPCSFMLIASTNPCPCGFYGTKEKECTCSQRELNSYKAKLSGPMIDRFDIHIKVPLMKYDDLKGKKEESSEEIRKRVNSARKIQKERYKAWNIYSNSDMTPALLEEYCKLDSESEVLLENILEKLKFSSRAYSKILKVARTIADLDSSEEIKKQHLLEAIQYRSLDRN